MTDVVQGGVASLGDMCGFTRVVMKYCHAVRDYGLVRGCGLFGCGVVRDCRLFGSLADFDLIDSFIDLIEPLG